MEDFFYTFKLLKLYNMFIWIPKSLSPWLYPKTLPNHHPAVFNLKLRLVTRHSFEETANVKNRIILFFRLFCQISFTVHYGRSPAKRIFQATRHWVIRTHCSPNSCFLTQSMRSVQLSSVPVFVYIVRTIFLCLWSEFWNIMAKIPAILFEFPISFWRKS